MVESPSETYVFLSPAAAAIWNEDSVIFFFLSLLEPRLPLVTGLEASRSQD